MDSTTPSIDFAAIGHQDTWKGICSFVNSMRTSNQEGLALEQIKNIFSFIPPRAIFNVKVKSITGAEINGLYIETFIDPDKLDSRFIRTNINKVTSAIECAKKMGAKIAALGGFTSIVLEGNLDSLTSQQTKLTTGNTLTAAYILKGIEKVALQQNIHLSDVTILIVGATGDIGLACVNYLKNKTRKLLLCARNLQRLEKLSNQLINEHVNLKYSHSTSDLCAEADIIICVASSDGLKFPGCKENVIICDAGYPKNIETKLENVNGFVFYGGMGQVSGGFTFSPDYSKAIYYYPAPHVIHGCLLEAMILAFENKIENYSVGKGNISVDKMEEIYRLGLKHGISIAPFFNANGLC